MEIVTAPFSLPPEILATKRYTERVTTSRKVTRELEVVMLYAPAVSPFCPFPLHVFIAPFLNSAAHTRVISAVRAYRKSYAHALTSKGLRFRGRSCEIPCAGITRQLPCGRPSSIQLRYFSICAPSRAADGATASECVLTGTLYSRNDTRRNITSQISRGLCVLRFSFHVCANFC